MGQDVDREREPLLYAAIGRIERLDGVICIVTDEGEAGCVLFGPYSVLSPGSYEVEFHAVPHDLHNKTCCVVDVLRRGRAIVAEKDFTALELTHRNGVMPVRFEVVEKDIFEFRLTATGTCGLTVRYQRPLRQISALDPEQPGD